MVTPHNPRIVAIEEHYWDKEVAASFGEVDAFRRQSDTVDRLYDYGEARIQEMDEAGIHMQVLSHGCLLYTSPSPRDKRQSRMPSSA